MQHAAWIAQARAHWKEHRPKAYREMVRKGTLETFLKAAADSTSQEMRDLMSQGFQYHEAWEVVRERHLFPPEESGNSEEAAASEGYKAMRQYYRDLSDLGGPDERED
jgi:hypothetical protein